MKINIALVLAIIIAVGIVALGFTAFQISSEKEQLTNELQVKTITSAEDFYSNYLDSLERGDSAQVHLNDSIIGQYNFLGVAIYYNADSIQTFNKETSNYVESSSDYITQAISADTSMSTLFEMNGKDVFVYNR